MYDTSALTLGPVGGLLALASSLLVLLIPRIKTILLVLARDPSEDDDDTDVFGTNNLANVPLILLPFERGRCCLLYTRDV